MTRIHYIEKELYYYIQYTVYRVTQKRKPLSKIIIIIWYKFVLNILCVTLFVTLSVAVFQAVIHKINAYDEIVIDNQKKRNYKINAILHKSPSNRRFRNGIRILLNRVDAIRSADIIYRM